jgi:hypothetical protein
MKMKTNLGFMYGSNSRFLAEGVQVFDFGCSSEIIALEHSGIRDDCFPYRLGAAEGPAFVVIFVCVLLGLTFIVWPAGLPGRIAIARKHPDAEAVRLWATPDFSSPCLGFRRRRGPVKVSDRCAGRGSHLYWRHERRLGRTSPHRHPYLLVAELALSDSVLMKGAALPLRAVTCRRNPDDCALASALERSKILAKEAKSLSYQLARLNRSCRCN